MKSAVDKAQARLLREQANAIKRKSKADYKSKVLKAKTDKAKIIGVEQEKTKRSLARSAAIASSFAEVAKARQPSYTPTVSTWNSIINGTNTDTASNQNTAEENGTTSTTETDRKS